MTPDTKPSGALNYLEWLQKGQLVNVRSNKLFVRQSLADKDQTILLLHGFPTSSWDWYKMWPLLEKEFNLVAPDFLGFGFSDKPLSYPYSIEDQSQLIRELLDLLEIRHCYILAHDYAVSVVQEWLALSLSGKLNFQIKKIILLNGGLFPETHRARPIQKLLLGKWGWIISKFLTKKSLERNLIQVFGPQTPPSHEEIDAFWEMIQYNKGKRIFHLLIRYMEDRRRNRDRWLEALRHTTIPIKLVNGPEDPVSGRHMVERYCQLIDDPDTLFLEGIGHYPNVEAPEQVARIAKEYFTKTRLSSTR